jgi:hypothetical protein
MARRFIELDHQFQSFKSRETLARKGRKLGAPNGGKTADASGVSPPAVNSGGK